MITLHSRFHKHIILWLDKDKVVFGKDNINSARPSVRYKLLLAMLDYDFYNHLKSTYHIYQVIFR